MLLALNATLRSVTPSETTPPVPTPAPAVPPTPPVAGPEKARPWWRRHIILIVAFAVPIVFLTYRLILGTMYSPSFVYSRNKAQVATKSEESIKRVRDKQDEIEAELMRLAPTLPADVPTSTISQVSRDPITGKVTTTTNTGILTEQMEAKGTLTRVSGEGIQNGCENQTKTAGSKFDKHDVGAEAFCQNATVRTYIWTGSAKKLQTLVDAMKAKYVVDEDQRYTVPQVGDKPLVIFEQPSAGYKITDYSLGDLSAAYGWHEVFDSQPIPQLPTISSSETKDLRLPLTVTVKERYFQLFDINY